MSILSKFEIKSKGKYLFYTVGEDSAVFLAVKIKKDRDVSTIVIPERIGKYTVRGITSIDSRAETIQIQKELNYDERWKLNRRLCDYYDISYFENCALPETIEYIGVLPESKGSIGAKKVHDRFVLPKNVSYIENSKISTKTLVLPKDIKYIGKVTDSNMLEKIFTGNENCDEGVPHYSIGPYRGEKVEDEFFHSKIIEKAFRQHSKLEHIILPDGIKEIEELAFSSIGQVEHFHFPKSLEKLSADAFWMTQFTGTFKYPSDFPVGLENDSYNFEIIGKILLENSTHCQTMINSRNSKGEFFTKFAKVLDFSYLEGRLPDRVFYNKSSFLSASQTILLGDNITAIGESAFEGNPISSLKLPSKLKSIGKNAFKGCPYLTKLELPDSLEIVGEGAFDTKCELIILASDETRARISGQKGYLEYSQKIAALQCKADEFIKKYKDYFDGKKTKNVPELSDLIGNWTDNGQNPKIYEKLLSLLKATVIDGKLFKKLINRARFLGLNSEAEEFEKIYTEKGANLTQSDLPSDWLAACKLNPDNFLSFYKIIEYLLMRFKKGVPNQILAYINSFMHAYSRKFENKNTHILGFADPWFIKLDRLYMERVGNRCYKEYGTKSHEKELFNIDRDLIEECKKACEENSPYAYFWRDLAVAFSPDFKPLKCSPKPKEEKAKPQKTVSASPKTYVPQFHSDFDFFNSDIAYTSLDTYSFKYTDEERCRAEEIISEFNAQKDAETYVAYLLDDIPTPSNLDYLVDKFSDIDWSDWGDV